MSDQFVDMLEAVQRPQVARLQAEIAALRAELAACPHDHTAEATILGHAEAYRLVEEARGTDGRRVVMISRGVGHSDDLHGMLDSEIVDELEALRERAEQAEADRDALADRVRELSSTVALLNSMILSGESHSDVSMKRVRQALGQG